MRSDDDRIEATHEAPAEVPTYYSLDRLWSYHVDHRRILLHRDIGDVRISLAEYERGFELFGPHACAWDSVELVLGGYGVERCRGQKRMFGPGSLLTYPPFSVHETTEAPAVIRICQVRLPQRLVPPASTVDDLDAHMRLQLTALAFKAYRELSSVDRESESRLSQIFDRMGALRQRSRLADTAAPAWCREVRETLDANRVDPPSLQELSEIVQVNRAHLARTFRKWTGCSVGEYSRALKVEATILPLARSRARAFEIAHRAGFADQSHFTRVFRSIFGVSPAAFRRDFLQTNEKF